MFSFMLSISHVGTDALGWIHPFVYRLHNQFTPTQLEKLLDINVNSGQQSPLRNEQNEIKAISQLLLRFSSANSSSRKVFTVCFNKRTSSSSTLVWWLTIGATIKVADRLGVSVSVQDKQTQFNATSAHELQITNIWTGKGKRENIYIYILCKPCAVRSRY